MTWIQNQLDDEKLFPQKIGTSGVVPIGFGKDS